MEFLLVSIVLLLSLLSIIIIITIYPNSKKSSSSSSLSSSSSSSQTIAYQLPSGRTGWPILGETLDFLSMGKKGTPEKFFIDRMNQYSPHVFKTSLFGSKTMVFCGPAGNKFLFSNDNKLVTNWWPRALKEMFPYISQTTKSDHGQESSIQFRKLVVGITKPDLLQKYFSTMDSIARKHVGDVYNQCGLNNGISSIESLSKHYNIVVTCRLFLSIEEPKNIAKFEKWLNAIVAGLITIPVDLPGTRLNRAIKASKSIRNEIMEIIKKRRTEMIENKKSMPSDILTHMLTTTDENGKFMPEVVIADNIVILAVAGNDTASVAITLIMKYLAELPEVYDNVLKKLREVELGKNPGELLNWGDLKYSWNVASEVMRLTPPAFGTFRQAITDFTYGGFYIRKGSKLLWTTYTTHKNPEYFPEPENFDPSRFDGNGPIPYTYVPFGGGSRICPGKEYVRLEILSFMYNMVRKFRWEKVVPDEKIVVDPVVKLAHGLPIRLYLN